MARKTTFSQDDVVQAALSVLEAEGAQAVTARRVADALGASTAPVYSNYANMDDLMDAVRSRVGDMILDYCRRPWSDDSFLSMGLGFMKFCIAHPRLFRAIYCDGTSRRCTNAHVDKTLLGDLDQHPILKDLPQDHREELLFQTSVYTLGIATTVVSGIWPDPDPDVLESWLRSVGGLLVRAAMESAGLPLTADLDNSLGTFVVPWRGSLSGHGQEESHED